MYNTKSNTRKRNHGLTGFNFDPFIDAFFQAPLVNDEIKKARNHSPAVNVTETENAFEVAIAAPGLTKADFNINVEKDKLTISVDKLVVDSSDENDTEKDAKETSKPVYKLREFNYDQFTKTFTLPKNAKSEAIEARYDLGILFLEIPKREIFKKTIEIA